jgi:hypothetical protein
MKRKFTFYKEDGIWFIKLKYWLGPKWMLAMVCGADILLEKLAEGKPEVILRISTKHFNEFHSVLTKENYDLKLSQGAVYRGGTSSAINNTVFKFNELWLCPVTLFVFGRYPEKIFYEVIK